MIFYRAFKDNICYEARPYQQEAFKNMETQKAHEVPYYFASTSGDIAFTLKRTKFPHTYLVVRDDKSLSGILTTEGIQVRSTHPDIQSAVIGWVYEDVNEKKSQHDYCIEYLGGIVCIKMGEKIWLDKGKIIIGWHGTYSPPEGM